MHIVGTIIKYFPTKVSTYSHDKLENTAIKQDMNFNQPSYEIFLLY